MKLAKKITTSVNNNNRSTKQITITENRPTYAPEIEALESRLLLSSITSKNYTFTDADGDKVNIRINGPGTFTLTLDNLDKTGADISSIVLNPDKSGNVGTLIITTTPVRISNPVQGVSPGLMSGGVAYVNEISVASGTKSVEGVVLNAVAAQSLNFGKADVNSILVTTGKALVADRFNNLSAGGFGGGTTELQNINVNNITADDIGSITIRGFAANTALAGSLYNGLGIPVGNLLNGLNNITGVISATKITSINAPLSSLGGTLEVNSVGTLKVGAINGDINVSGDFNLSVNGNLTKTIKAGGNITLYVGGNITATGAVIAGQHLNIQVVGDAGGIITAGAGISGLSSIKTDSITFGSASAIITATAGNIADLTVLGGITGGNITTQAGDIGKISVSTNLSGAITSAGKIGDISANQIAAAITAVNDIGNITIGTGGSTGAGDIESTKGNIGTVTSSASILGDLKADNGTIGNITLSGATSNLGGVVSANSLGKITVGGNIFGPITTDVGAIGAITANKITAVITAQTDIDSITVNDNINAAITTNVGKIGDISAKGINAAITAQTNIGKITVGDNGITGNIISNTGDIGNITSSGTISGNIVATKGAIGTITVNVTGNNDGISNNIINAAKGIGAITVTAVNGNAINSVEIKADTDNDGTGALASLTATTATKSALVTTAAKTISGASIGNITAIVSEDGQSAIDGGPGLTIHATQGNIGAIVAKVEGTNATGDAIKGTVTFTAENKSGSGATLVDTGAIGEITVKNSSTQLGADGINGTVTLNAGGKQGSVVNVGNITVTVTHADAIGIGGLTINANNNTTPAASKTGSVGNISVTGGNGITGLTINAYKTIGSITSTGDDDQTVTLKAQTTGAINFSNLANNKTLTLNIAGTGAGTKAVVGDITIDSPGAATNKGNLTLGGGSIGSLETVGNLIVDGNVSFGNSLTGLKTIGSININKFNATAGSLTIGSVSGSTTGYIQIADSSSSNAFDFIFTNYTLSDGTTKAGNFATAVVGVVQGTNLNTGTAAGQIGHAAGQTVGSITFKYIA